MNNSINNFMYNVIRRAGVQLNPTQLEDLRTACDSLEEQIKTVAEEKAMEICGRLQENITEAFENIDKIVQELDRTHKEIINDLNPVKKNTN